MHAVEGVAVVDDGRMTQRATVNYILGKETRKNNSNVESVREGEKLCTCKEAVEGVVVVVGRSHRTRAEILS